MNPDKNMKTDIESLTNHVLDYDIRLLTISSIGPSLTFLKQLFLFTSILSCYTSLLLLPRSCYFILPVCLIHFPYILLTILSGINLFRSNDTFSSYH